MKIFNIKLVFLTLLLANCTAKEPQDLKGILEGLPAFKKAIDLGCNTIVLIDMKACDGCTKKVLEKRLLNRERDGSYFFIFSGFESKTLHQRVNEYGLDIEKVYHDKQEVVKRKGVFLHYGPLIFIEIINGNLVYPK